MKTTRIAAGLVTALIAFAMHSPTSHADAQSYLAYLQSHGTNTSLWPDTRKVDAGERLCSMLHSGMTPDQIIGSAGLHVVDAPGILDAAQHELCPDTLR
jgi:hypothetical protein